MYCVVHCSTQWSASTSCPVTPSGGPSQSLTRNLECPATQQAPCSDEWATSNSGRSRYKEKPPSTSGFTVLEASCLQPPSRVLERNTIRSQVGSFLLISEYSSPRGPIWPCSDRRGGAKQGLTLARSGELHQPTHKSQWGPMEGHQTDMNLPHHAFTPPSSSPLPGQFSSSSQRNIKATEQLVSLNSHCLLRFSLPAASSCSFAVSLA